MNRRYLVLIPLLLGIILVLNPFYVYPDGTDRQVTYTTEPIENESMATTAISRSDKVVSCPGVRLCATEEAVIEEGAIEYDGHVASFRESVEQYEDPGWYPIVRIGDELYRPEHESGENATVLMLSAVDAMEAVEYTAVPVDRFSDDVREAVETGSVTLSGEFVDAFERNEIIEYQGDYYTHASRSSSSRSIDDSGLLVIRTGLYALGIGLLVRSGWRLKETAS